MLKYVVGLFPYLNFDRDLLDMEIVYGPENGVKCEMFIY